MSAMKRVMSEGFRVFFLCAGIYGVITGVIWALWFLALEGWGMNPLEGADHRLWHAHEMVFGYAGAALGGFFLTAVPNWTNTPTARIGFLTAVSGLWLAGRLALWFAPALPAGVVAAVDLLFIPALALKIATQLIKRPKPQNMMFLLILALLWTGNLFMHLEWMQILADGANTGVRAGLFAIAAMIVVLGGRITPAFTRNAMKREGVEEGGWPVSATPVERANLGLALALPVLVLLPLPAALAGACALLLGLVQVVRLARWRGLWALRQPILFALHLGLGMLGLGLVLWGLSAFGVTSEIGALHVIGIGGVGGMTLAVMSRAALGHSGRPLVAPRMVSAAYALLALTAAVRWLAEVTRPDSYLILMAGISLMWAAVFLIFTLSLWPALTQPRLSDTGPA